MSAAAILMIVHSYCPGDPRVRREAEALASRGNDVDVICLRGPGQAPVEMKAGVRYLRLPLRRRRGGMARYVFEYTMLLVGAGALTALLQIRRRYRVVQTHNMPDLLVYAGIVPWLCGARVVLDLHDPVPELYRAKFGFDSGAPLIRLLSFIEGCAVDFADHVFAATEAFRTRLLERGRPASRIEVLLNSPDPALFHPMESAPRAEGPLRILFHGTITQRSGVDLAIRATEEVRRRGVDVRLIILGEGDFLSEVRRAASVADRPSWVEIRPPVPIEEVPSVVASCDLGIIPNRPGPFNDLALPTRLFESLAMARPVIVARSPAISALFPAGELLEFEAGDEADLVRVLERACRDPDLRRASVDRGMKTARAHEWEKEKRVYLDAIDELLDGRPVRDR